MSAHVYSMVLIAPIHLQDKANRLACALGHDLLPGSTFSAPLSSDGTEPITHYGCRTSATQTFVDIIAGTAQGELPAIEWVNFGLTEADVREILAGLVIDVRGSSEEPGHYDSVISSQGLKRAVIKRERT